MTEAEILEQIQNVRGNIGGFVSVIISVQFAMVVGIYYFLNRARWPLKVGSFAVYSIGYLNILGLYGWETTHLLGLARALRDLKADGAITPAGDAILAWHEGMGGFQNVSAWIGFLLFWLVISYFLFVYKVRDEEAGWKP
jgi:hypothetical protein